MQKELKVAKKKQNQISSLMKVLKSKGIPVEEIYQNEVKSKKLNSDVSSQVSSAKTDNLDDESQNEAEEGEEKERLQIQEQISNSIQETRIKQASKNIQNTDCHSQGVKQLPNAAIPKLDLTNIDKNQKQQQNPNVVKEEQAQNQQQSTKSTQPSTGNQVPQLKFNQNGPCFHVEFMSRYDEFSESWRNAILRNGR